MATFVIFSGNDEIGVSELENPDQSMGTRMGCFRPGDGYGPWEALVQELSMASFEAHTTREGDEERRRLQARVAELSNKTSALDLRVETKNGHRVDTAWVYIEDFAQELGVEERHITICVADSDTYEQFFE